jgi:hypothetical protein
MWRLIEPKELRDGFLDEIRKDDALTWISFTDFINCFDCMWVCMLRDNWFEFRAADKLNLDSLGKFLYSVYDKEFVFS